MKTKYVLNQLKSSINKLNRVITAVNTTPKSRDYLIYSKTQIEGVIKHIEQDAV